MNINTSIYDTPVGVNNKIYISLNIDYKILNRFLFYSNSDNEYIIAPISLFDQKDYDRIINRNKGYLHDVIIQNIYLFIRDVLHIDIDKDKERFRLNDEIVESLIKLRNLYIEQLKYMHAGIYNETATNLYDYEDLYQKKMKDINYNKDCKSWYIETTLENHIYGGIFAFWNVNTPKNIMIQGIAKRLIPMLISIFLPEYNKLLPKLNTTLESGIESLANRLDATNIYVIPIGKQGDILEKYYGYIKIDPNIINQNDFDFRYPCIHILGHVYNINIIYEQGQSIYVKHL